MKGWLLNRFGLCVWFSRDNLRRCEIGWNHPNWRFWWAIFGFSGGLI